MADDTEQLVLSISADTRQILNALKRLETQTKGTTDNLATYFNSAGASADPLAKKLDMVGVSAQRASKEIEAGTGRSRQQVIQLTQRVDHLQAAFSGTQSPMQIALQQASHFNEILAGSTLTEAVSAVGGAFMGLLNPISLASIAIIGAGAYAVDYFSKVENGGKLSAEQLKQQAELIANVAKKWGDALTELKKYQDEEGQKKDIDDVNKASQVVVQKKADDAKKAIEDAAVGLAGIVSKVQFSGAPKKDINDFTSAIHELTNAGDDSNKVIKAAKNIQSSLAALVKDTGIPAIKAFSASFDTLVTNITNATDAIKKLKDQQVSFTQNRFATDELINHGNALGGINPIYSNNGRFETEEQSQISDAQQAALEAAGQSAAAAMIKGFETFQPNAKWDVNHYRAGFGSSTVTDSNGNVSSVTASTVVTLQEAQDDLARRIVEFQTAIQKAIGIDTWQSLSDGQQAALTSIAYNYGKLPKAIVTAIKNGGGPEAVAQAIAALGTDNGGINAARRKSEARTYLSGTGYSLKDAGIDINNKVSGSARVEANTEKQIAELNAQAQAYASLTPAINDYGAAVAAAKKEQELLSAAQADGTINNPGVKEYIHALAEQYGEATAAMARAKEAQQQLKATIQQTEDAARQFVGTFVDDLINGKKATEALGDALKQLGSRLLSLGLDEIFGGGSVKNGGLFGSLFSSLFSGLGHFATGTNYAPGGLAIVGENGPELVNLPRGSQVLPNTQTMSVLRAPVMPTMAARSSGPSTTTMHVTVAVTGVGDKDLLAKTTQGATLAVNQALSNYDKGLPKKVAHLTKNPRLR